MKLKNYTDFIKEGKREEDEINRLLDLMDKRQLTDEEKKLLSDLSSGKKLEEEKPTLAKHKTGGLLFDEEGDVITHGEEPKAGEEFVTKKGKQSSLEVEHDDRTNARVYRANGSDERFYFVSSSDGWIVYRTGGKYEFGMFLSKDSKYYGEIASMNVDELWDDLNWKFDIGMELDKKTLDDFKYFMELYYEKDQKKYKEYLKVLYKKLSTLI